MFRSDFCPDFCFGFLFRKRGPQSGAFWGSTRRVGLPGRAPRANKGVGGWAVSPDLPRGPGRSDPLHRPTRGHARARGGEITKVVRGGYPPCAVKRISPPFSRRISAIWQADVRRRISAMFARRASDGGHPPFARRTSAIWQADIRLSQADIRLCVVAEADIRLAGGYPPFDRRTSA